MEEIIKYLGPSCYITPSNRCFLTLLLFIYGKFSKIELTIPIRLGLVFSLFSIISSILGFILQYYGDYDGNLIDFHMWLGISTTIYSV